MCHFADLIWPPPPLGGRQFLLARGVGFFSFTSSPLKWKLEKSSWQDVIAEYEEGNKAWCRMSNILCLSHC
jgi:hypothetical protein